LPRQDVGKFAGARIKKASRTSGSRTGPVRWPWLQALPCIRNETDASCGNWRVIHASTLSLCDVFRPLVRYYLQADPTAGKARRLSW